MTKKEYNQLIELLYKALETAVDELNEKWDKSNHGFFIPYKVDEFLEDAKIKLEKGKNNEN